MKTVTFPIGHYLGEFASDAEFDGGHQVRVGQDTVSLTDPEFLAWVEAHEESIRNDRLSGLGVLVTVDEGSAAEFAQRYRLRPLLSALGKSGQNVAMGLGSQVTAVVDELTHQLWWWAGPSKNLWTLCQRTGSSPSVALDHFYKHGHALLAGGAAYLDLA